MFRKTDWSLLIVTVCLTVCFLWFFHKPLFGEYDFIYRDAGRFYLPLYELIHNEWREGRVPLWNPYDNSGSPLLANATAGVFYPGKQIFLLPMEFEAKFKAYILIHVIFVAVSSFLVARFWKLSTPAAGLVALSYPFSGMVIFQFCNVVFLVSAGWLPWGLFFGERLLQKYSLRRLLGLSFSLAMMVLGGDPQMAYHVGLILGVRLLVMWWTKLPESIGDACDQPQNERLAIKMVGRRAGRLMIAAAIAGGLAAIQVLPTAEFGKHSVRATSEVPRSIWQVPGHWLSSHDPKLRPDTGQPPNWYDCLVGDPPPPAKHDFQIYSFSFAPIRVIEFLFPNVTGPNFSSYPRWTTNYGWESANVWMPSVYFGLIPFLLTVFAFFIPCETRRTRWLKAIAMLALLASFGRYGLVWLMNLVAPPIGETPTPFGEAVGGLYWMLNVLLPAYSDFRFPAKWITVTTFGFTMLAGYGLDRLQDESLKKLVARILLPMFVIVGLTFIGVCFSFPGTKELYANALWRQLYSSVFHTLAILVILGLLYRFGRRSLNDSRLCLILLSISAIDLVVANSQNAQVVRRAEWHWSSQSARAMTRYEENSPQNDASPVRFFRPFYFTPEPKHGDRSVDGNVMIQERRVLGGYSHYEFDLSMTFLYSTVVMNEYEAYFDPLAVNEELAFSAPRMALDAWGTKYFILPAGDHYDDPKWSTLGLRSKWKPLAWQTGQPPIPWPVNNELPVLFDNEQFKVVLNEDRFPHAWMVRDVEVIPPMDAKDSARWVPLMQSIIYPNAHRIDLRKNAIVEYDDQSVLKEFNSLPTTRQELVRVVSYEPDRIVIDADIERSGLLVVADAFYPGWNATIQTDNGETRPAQIYRTNRMMRGVALETAGKHRITFRYQPWSFYLGAMVSILTSVCVMVVVVISTVRSRKPAIVDERSNSDGS